MAPGPKMFPAPSIPILCRSAAIDEPEIERQFLFRAAADEVERLRRLLGWTERPCPACGSVDTCLDEQDKPRARVDLVCRPCGNRVLLFEEHAPQCPADWTAWKPCPDCGGTWCAVHDTHVGQEGCDCPALAQWAIDPFTVSAAFVKRAMAGGVSLDCDAEEGAPLAAGEPGE